MLGLGPASLLRAERAGERVGLAEQCGALAAPFESTRREDLAVLSVLGRALWEFLRVMHGQSRCPDCVSDFPPHR